MCQGIILVIPQWLLYHHFIVVETESWSGHVTHSRPYQVLSGGVRTWSQAVWLIIASTTQCYGKETGVDDLATWDCFFLNISCTSLNISYIFVLASFENVHFTHLCLWKSSCSFKDWEGHLGGESKYLLPIVRIELFTLESFIWWVHRRSTCSVSPLLYSLYPPQLLHIVGTEVRFTDLNCIQGLKY